MKFGDMAYGQNNNSSYRPTKLRLESTLVFSLQNNKINPIFLKLWVLDVERLCNKLAALQFYCTRSL